MQLARYTLAIHGNQFPWAAAVPENHRNGPYFQGQQLFHSFMLVPWTSPEAFFDRATEHKLKKQKIKMGQI
jgi:hypothetical protein